MYFYLQILSECTFHWRRLLAFFLAPRHIFQKSINSDETNIVFLYGALLYTIQAPSIMDPQA